MIFLEMQENFDSFLFNSFKSIGDKIVTTFEKENICGYIYIYVGRYFSITHFHQDSVIDEVFLNRNVKKYILMDL